MIFWGAEGVNTRGSELLFFFFNFFYLWLCWVFVSVWGLSLVVASGGHSSSRCTGLSLSRPLLLRSTGSRRAGSVIVAHGPSRSAACGIFPDQGSNPCALHWQADSQPLRHQGSPTIFFILIRSAKLDTYDFRIHFLLPLHDHPSVHRVILSTEIKLQPSICGCGWKHFIQSHGILELLKTSKITRFKSQRLSSLLSVTQLLRLQLIKLFYTQHSILFSTWHQQCFN